MESFEGSPCPALAGYQKAYEDVLTTVPRVGIRSPTNIPKVVLLPAPFAPSRPRHSPENHFIVKLVLIMLRNFDLILHIAILNNISIQNGGFLPGRYLEYPLL